MPTTECAKCIQLHGQGGIKSSKLLIDRKHTCRSAPPFCLKWKIFMQKISSVPSLEVEFVFIGFLPIQGVDYSAMQISTSQQAWASKNFTRTWKKADRTWTTLDEDTKPSLRKWWWYFRSLTRISNSVKTSHVIGSPGCETQKALLKVLHEFTEFTRVHLDMWWKVWVRFILFWMNMGIYSSSSIC